MIKWNISPDEIDTYYNNIIGESENARYEIYEHSKRCSYNSYELVIFSNQIERLIGTEYFFEIDSAIRFAEGYDELRYPSHKEVIK